MIKEKYVLIKGHPRNIKYYSDLGYDIQVRQEIEVLTTDLMSGSSTKITSICSNCGTESTNTFKDYWIYTNGLVNKFYCIKCKGIKTVKTCLDKYGVSNPMKNDNVKNKIKQNNLDKYDDKTAFNSGVLLFNNCQTIRDLFNDIKQHMINDPDKCWFYDQPYIVYNTMTQNLHDNKALKEYVLLNDINLFFNYWHAFSDKTLIHFIGTPGNYGGKSERMTQYLDELKTRIPANI